MNSFVRPAVAREFIATVIAKSTGSILMGSVRTPSYQSHQKRSNFRARSSLGFSITTSFASDSLIGVAPSPNIPSRTRPRRLQMIAARCRSAPRAVSALWNWR